MLRLVSVCLSCCLWLWVAVAAAEAPVDFALPDGEGDTLRLSEQRGQVVMVNFWASWCPPCVREMPELDAIYQDLRDDGLVLWGVNVDHDRAAADELLEELSPSFPILYDPESRVRRKMGVDAMPTTLLVDRAGQVRHVNRGYQPGDEDKYRAQAEALLAEEESGQSAVD